MQHAFKTAASLIFSAALLMSGAGTAAAQGLPSGATSLNETHGDWTVACATQAETVRCAVSQVQVNSENRQRVLTVELTATEGGSSASGTLVMPFGLALENGVTISIDEGAAMQPLRFSTCLPAGCLVPLAFNQETITAMRAGTSLKAKATANGGGQEVNFSISLAGFTSALARAAELIGS